jgi:hypothetical protein
VEKKECNFLSTPQEPDYRQTNWFKIVKKELSAQIARYILSAPLEEKGYKCIINLPDWQNKQKNIIKSKKTARRSGIFLSVPCSGSHDQQGSTYATCS